MDNLLFLYVLLQPAVILSEPSTMVNDVGNAKRLKKAKFSTISKKVNY